MPPRKGPRNIVTSGAAGNSSKSKPKVPNPNDIPDGPPRPPPLFPVGYKTPVTLLNEKCQKAGWERPSVESHPNRGSQPTTFTSTVTLKKRRNKNAMDFDIVRLIPQPPIEQKDSAMARHFGATYALFRFCNNLPMAMLLPPVIRPYWSDLLAEKAKAPAHRDWEWAEDPFAARKEVDSRQEKKKEQQVRQAEFKHGLKSGTALDDGNAMFVAKGTQVKEDDGRGRGAKGGLGWSGVPEVKMTVPQREIVEAVIRKVGLFLPAAHTL